MEEQKKQEQGFDAPAGQSQMQGAASETSAPETGAATPLESTPQSEVSGATASAGNTKNFTIAAIVIAVAVLAGLYYFLMGPGATSEQNGDEATTAQGANAIDPDSVVARVNGTELSGRDLSYQLTQVAQVAGIPSLDAVDQQTFAAMKAQAIDAIVNTEVLVQAATDEGLSVSDAEVEAEYSTIVESIGGQEVADERLAALGITDTAFKGNLHSDLLIQKYLDVHADQDLLAVSDSEVEAFYNQVTNGQTEGVPTLADVELQIRQQLSFQKEQEVLVSFLEGLREAADIEILAQ